jgi:phosphoethanolamine N-methyltransferase
VHPDRCELQPEEEANRYTRRSILRSEKIYGDGFQSPGGINAMVAFCSKLHMKQGMKILDIGSGLGGAAFYFAKNYGATVLGLDVCQEMVNICSERMKGMKDSCVSFKQGDIRTAQLLKDTFDLAWTRDSILHVAEKDLVWKKIYGTLKRGGQLFSADFCKGNGPLSESFIRYLENCQYHLQDLASYGRALEAAGFRHIQFDDNTKTYSEYLRKELRDLKANRENFLREYNERDFDYLVNRWVKKIQFCEQGDFVCGVFTAKK